MTKRELQEIVDYLWKVDDGEYYIDWYNEYGPYTRDEFARKLIQDEINTSGECEAQVEWDLNNKDTLTVYELIYDKVIAAIEQDNITLQEATMLALQGKLQEEKYLVDRRDYQIRSKHEADWFGSNACWKDVLQLPLKTMSDEKRIKSLQLLKYNIDTEVKQRADYNDISPEYVEIWIDAYKRTIDGLLNEINTKGKYYILLNVDIDSKGDVDHRGGYLTIENGKIIKNNPTIKYYDSKDEAIKDMNSISKSQYKEFIDNNYLSDYDNVIQWNVEVKQYEPNTWELK